MHGRKVASATRRHFAYKTHHGRVCQMLMHQDKRSSDEQMRAGAIQPRAAQSDAKLQVNAASMSASHGRHEAHDDNAMQRVQADVM